MISETFNEDNMVCMARYPDKYFDLALCDPEYGIGVGKMAFLKEMKTTVKQKNGSRINGNMKKVPYDKKDWDNKPATQEYFNEISRISKHQIIFGINYFDWVGVGSGRIIWDKRVPKGVSFSRYEHAYCSMIDGTEIIELLWSGMMQAKSVTEPTIQQGNKKLNEKRIHPCHKPIFLYDILYHLFLPEGGLVIDTHLGAGSSRISAYKRGNIDFTSCELDKEHFEAQEKRFAEFLINTMKKIAEKRITKEIGLFQ